MAKSKILSDKEKSKIVLESLKEFNKLVKGHRKLLQATAEL